MQEYLPQEIETKWQNYWEEQGLLDFDFASEKPKFYMLTMLPYPSGDLHIGHWYAMAPSDCYARFMKMQGNEVFFPIGFDHVENQFEALLQEGVDGVHIYALNRLSTVERLGPILKDASGTISTPHL